MIESKFKIGDVVVDVERINVNGVDTTGTVIRVIYSEDTSSTLRANGQYMMYSKGLKWPLYSVLWHNHEYMGEEYIAEYSEDWLCLLEDLERGDKR